MNETQFTATISLTLVAVLVLGADILVRLLLLPRQREKFVLSMMDHLREPFPEATSRDATHSEEHGAATVRECRLRNQPTVGQARERELQAPVL